MRQYVYKGVIYDTLPDPLENTSPITEETFVSMGGEFIEIETPLEREFKEACKGFRQICYEVRILSGNPSFKGGIDEMRDLLKTDIAARYPNEFQRLSTLFTWYDKECTYLGGRLGLGQPAWWYKCWEYEKEEQQIQIEPVLYNPYDEEQNPYDELNPYNE